MSRRLKLELFLVSPFSRVLLGFQCFWDRHRSAFRMDESARHIWHVLLAYSHWHHTVGASVTSWQSRQLHDVFVHVPGDNSLWGARGEVCYTALRRLKQKSKSTQTLICSVKPFRNHGLSSLAQMKGPVRENCGGWVLVTVVKLPKNEDEHNASIFVTWFTFKANIVFYIVLTYVVCLFKICWLHSLTPYLPCP